MQTQDLIKALSADAGRSGPPLDRLWLAALLLAVLVAIVVFFAVVGARPDIAAAAGTVRFLFKFVITGLLAATAIPLLAALARPEPPSRRELATLAAAPLLLLAAVLVELTLVPPPEWGVRMLGTNSLSCLSFIPLMGIGPLALFIFALRRAAPGRPPLAGAVAGLAAGGIAATLYAAHCTDDSPLFVATWYTLAVALLAVVGALASRAFARW